MRYLSIICLFILNNVSAQGFIEKLITTESNIKVIEERANEYLKKVKNNKENKLFSEMVVFCQN